MTATTATTSTVPVQVLFDSQQRKIVYAEARGPFVDGLCKLLVAPLHEVVRFAGVGAPPAGGYPAHDGHWATSALPFAALSKSISELDEGLFSRSGDVNELPYFEAPCALKILEDNNNEEEEDEEEDIDEDDDEDEEDEDDSDDSDDGDDGDGSHAGHNLKPRVRLLVSNGLEVSELSSITCVDLLRRHAPDATRWGHFVGVALEVDEEDFRAIARSALAGRSCALQDALGPKAAAAFELARNAAAAAPAAAAAATPFAPAAVTEATPLCEGVTPADTATFLAAELRNSSPYQRMLLGSALHPFVHRMEPARSDKITGMLIEMDQSAVLHLIRSPDALRAKMKEAIAVLEADGYVAPAAVANISAFKLRLSSAAFDARIEEPLKALNAIADREAESLKAAEKELKAYERSAAKVAAFAAAKSNENEATEEAADGIIATAADSSLLPAAAAAVTTAAAAYAEAAKLRHPGALSDSDEEPFWEAPPASTSGRVSVGTQTADSARDAQPPEPPVQIAAAAADILQASTEAGWNFGDFAAEPNTPTAASNDSFDMLDSDGL